LADISKSETGIPAAFWFSGGDMSGSKFILSAAVLGTLLGIGSASAADLPARTYSKAPAPIVAPSWTGFYIFGGAGGGLWAADSATVLTPTGFPLSLNQRLGGSGWYGTVGAGYDWQFNSSWVAGILADGQFGSIKGTLSDIATSLSGTETLRTSYAVGARVGYLVAPNVLSYVNGGYSGSQWSGSTLSAATGGLPVPFGTPVATTTSFTRNGFFIGGGVENNLDIFGIKFPGLFMKTEYRAAYYGRVNLPETPIGAGIATGYPTTLSDTFKPWNQTISTSLVYRFNWTGPVVAKY
jgi:outer membrane immunogenic protein